jgi:hypothetical protein
VKAENAIFKDLKENYNSMSALENIVNDQEDMKYLVDQSAAIMAMHGLPDNALARELMAPLIEGHLTIEEHMSMLESMMQRLQNG